MEFTLTLEKLKSEALEALKTSSLETFEALEIEYLGRKGKLAEQMKQLATVSGEDRPRLGAAANQVKQALEQAFQQKKEELQNANQGARFESERVDVTEPGEKLQHGHLHIVTQAIREITDIFARAGFVRTRYPEVEWDWFVFEGLNMNQDHPARDEWETFFMDASNHPKLGNMILTTQATSGTARHLSERKPPIRAINIQKTYRRQMDITHVPMFHQFDGVFVDENVNVTHLLGILDYFVKEFFGPERKVRLRPYHFRFTEPSFEIDISCGVCGGAGKMEDGSKCRTCKRGWLELGGAGMLHPNVLKAAGIDPKKYSGLAFGWGVERTYMMKEGLQLDDIRTLYKNDLRFLQQF